MVSENGRRLFYLYTAPLDGGQVQQIPALYDLDRNTAVFYYFENFLSPVELDFEYDVSQATAIGFDAGNEYLLVGYARRQDPLRGGVFRLDIGEEFRLVDQTDLPAPPLALFTR